jgi:biopolymer transport protein ExbB
MPINITELFLRVTYLGAEWVMWLLVGLSLLSVTVMVERTLFMLVRRVNFNGLSADLKTALSGGDVDGALRMVAGRRPIECQVLAAGLAEVGRGAHAVSEAMLSAKARERLKLERYLPVLGTLGNNAPFIGLFGTVLGIIKAAHDMTAQAQAPSQGAANAVMAGVFEALVATAVGLFVAIPAVVAYNIFQRRVRSALGRVDVLAHLLLSHLKADGPGLADLAAPPAINPAARVAAKPAPPKPAQAPHGR